MGCLFSHLSDYTRGAADRGSKGLHGMQDGEQTPEISEMWWLATQWSADVPAVMQEKEGSNETLGISKEIILEARKELAQSSAPFSHTKLAWCAVAVYCFPLRH